MMGPIGSLDCELYLTAANHCRLAFADHDYSGRPALDESLKRDLLAAAHPDEYGRLLFEALFPPGDGELLMGFRDARVIARRSGLRLRLRLHVATTAPAWLHGLLWELLYDPREQLALGRSREVVLSRYLSVPGELEPATERPRLLVVLSCPTDLEEYGLRAFDEERMRASLRRALDPLEGLAACEFLDGPATVGRICDRLVAGNFDACHLQAHGVLHRDRPVAHLVLEDPARRAKFVDEGLFSEVFEGQRDLRLVTLAACRSGETSLEDPFSGLGPALVRRGIPAVLAMQRAVSIETASLFTRHFYRNLARDGRVDVATNEARLQLHLADSNSFAWATPALFMHVSESRLWQPPQALLAKLKPPGSEELERPALQRQSVVRNVNVLILFIIALMVLTSVFRGFFQPRAELAEPPRLAVFLDEASPSAWLAQIAVELVCSRVKAGGGDCRIEPEPRGPESIDLEALGEIQKDPGGNVVLVPEQDGHERIRLYWWFQDARTGQLVRRKEPATGVIDMLPTVSRLSEELLALPMDSVDTGGLAHNIVRGFTDPDAEDLYKKALEALEVLDAPAARKALEEALRLDPESPDLHATMADAFRRLGDDKKAKEHVHLALEKSHGRSHEERFFYHALGLEIAGQWQKAAAVIEAIRSSRNASVFHEYKLRHARLLIESGDFRAARDILEGLEGAEVADLRVPMLQSRAEQEIEKKIELISSVIAEARKRALPIVLAEAHLLKAEFQQGHDGFDAARAQAEEARQIYRESGHSLGQAEAANTLGYLLWEQRRLGEARDRFEQAYKGFREARRDLMAIHAKTNIALIRQEEGDLESSAEMYWYVLEEARKIGDRVTQAQISINLAVVLDKLGEFAEATSMLAEVQGHIADLELNWKAWFYFVSADHEMTVGRLSKAESFFRDMMDIANNPSVIGLASLLKARLEEYRGDLEAAEKNYTKASEVFAKIGAKRDLALALRGLAGVYLKKGMVARGRKEWGNAQLIDKSDAMPGSERPGFLILEARLLRAEGDLQRATKAAHDAAMISESQRAVLDESVARDLLAQIHLDGKNLEEADLEIREVPKQPNGEALGAPIVEFPIDITTARILAGQGKVDVALTKLNGVLQGVAPERFLEWELEAKIVRAEIKVHSGVPVFDLDRIEREARNRGYLLIAERAAGLRAKQASQAEEPVRNRTAGSPSKT